MAQAHRSETDLPSDFPDSLLMLRIAVRMNQTDRKRPVTFLIQFAHSLEGHPLFERNENASCGIESFSNLCDGLIKRLSFANV